MFLGVKQIEIDTSDWISIEIYDQWSRQAKSPSRKQDSHGVTGRKPWPKIHDLLKWLDQPLVFFRYDPAYQKSLRGDRLSAKGSM